MRGVTSVLGMSNELSKALQRKDQDIMNATQLVRLCKRRLQIMRDEGWEFFLEEVCSFRQQHYIHVSNMDDMFVRLALRGRSQQLNNRFSEVNTELLLCVACLCPQDSFSSFDKKSLIRLAEFYPLDFSVVNVIVLSDQLETYIFHMHSNKEFEGLNDLGDLAEKLVLTKKNKAYPLIYRLLTLALILPIATAIVERVFSAMSIVKNKLRNRIAIISASNSFDTAKSSPYSLVTCTSPTCTTRTQDFSIVASCDSNSLCHTILSYADSSLADRNLALDIYIDAWI
ncbi:uncharacterized protein LOC111411131 [Olea europaea var. sylvestris]|uniref:uncharacterized protein LOC111411131 n=1 Tax=Olea europaea var. sylvestris TaxID=158386 RepID=UPI000C1CF555|nr:uncharacterized protein LOC111411131 [Olea europaea var. sylvestris]